jgi:DNA-binding protein YbaB
MDTSPDHRLEQLLADFAERYEAATRAQAQIRSLSVTAQSRDGVVEATIDVNGTAPTVRFVDKRFRDMPDSELADDVLDALATAQAEAVLRIDVLRTYAKSWLPARGASWIGTDSSTRTAVSCTRRSPDMIGSSLGSGPSPLKPRETCWGRMVRRARMVADAHLASLDADVTQGNDSLDESRWHALQNTWTGHGYTKQLSQRPLWGSEHRETGSDSGTTPLPAELCEAVAALGDAICAATDCFCLVPASGDSNWFEVSGSSRGVAIGR